MKKTIFLLLVILFCGCEHSKLPEPVEKTIVNKLQATEQRLGIDFFDRQAFRSRAKEVYYLVADDDTFAEVDMADWIHTHNGDKWSTTNWRQK